jgi:Domain of unknown function (DUF4926)
MSIPMTTPEIAELDVVALTCDLPEQPLRRGQVGTVVMVHVPNEVFEVEFVDAKGNTYSLATLRRDQLLKLHFEATAA